MKGFWNSIISSKDPASAKRLITLIVSLHFIISSFVILFIASYVIFYLPKGKVEPSLLATLKDILEYDMWIILAGLGFITAENVGSAWLERVKAKFTIPSITDPAAQADLAKNLGIEPEQK